MENIDLCNSTGELLGQIASRDEVHTQGHWHRTVHVWILNSQHQLLIQQRSPLKDTNPNLWDVSAAGHLSAGQNSLDAAMRELEEELGVVALAEELQFLFHVKHETKVVDDGIWDREIQDVYLLRKDVLLNTLVSDPEEVQSVAWIPVEELHRHVDNRSSELVEHDEEYQLLWPILESTRA